jgi:hypothetical protein
LENARLSFGDLTLALILLAVLVAFVRLRDLWRQQSIEELMQTAFDSEERREAFEDFELMVDENRAALAYHRGHAHRRRDEGQSSAAVEMLAAGCSTMATLAPSYLEALRKLRELAQPLSAIAPLDPLGPRSFGTAPLRGLGAGSLFVHHLLLTGKERVVWKLRVLGAVFRYGLRLLRQAVDRLPAHEPSWRRVDSVVDDLDAVGEHSVAVARRILLTMDAFDRLDAIGPASRR